MNFAVIKTINKKKAKLATFMYKKSLISRLFPTRNKFAVESESYWSADQWNQALSRMAWSKG